jgi:hypothetical protein
MKLLRTLQRLWIGPYIPLKRPAFPVCDELEARARAIRIREKLGDPKPIRKLIEEPTYRESTRWGWDANGSPIE